MFPSNLFSLLYLYSVEAGTRPDSWVDQGEVHHGYQTSASEIQEISVMTILYPLLQTMC